MADGYRPAAICRRGHVINPDTTLGEPTNRCTKCGDTVITVCVSCETSIRGRYHADGIVNLSPPKYRPPDFCFQCGSPFPWLSRQGRIYELMNRLDEEELDPATELAVREQLEALTNPLDEEDELRAWERVRKLAPGFWAKTGAQSILTSVVSAVLKDRLAVD